MSKIIKCKECGEMKPHVAHGLGRSCYMNLRRGK